MFIISTPYSINNNKAGQLPFCSQRKCSWYSNIQCCQWNEKGSSGFTGSGFLQLRLLKLRCQLHFRCEQNGSCPTLILYIASTARDPKDRERSELYGRESDLYTTAYISSWLGSDSKFYEIFPEEVVNRKSNRGWLVYRDSREFFMDYGNLQATSLIKRKHNLKPKEIDWFTHIYEIFYGLQKFADDTSNKHGK